MNFVIMTLKDCAICCFVYVYLNDDLYQYLCSFLFLELHLSHDMTSPFSNSDSGFSNTIVYNSSHNNKGL